jgi:hypothetical protein
VEEDIPKVAVRHTLHEDEVKFERERELVEGALGRKGIIMTIIIIIII